MELSGGNYRVLFRLKVGANSGIKPLAKLYVKAIRAGVEQELASAILRPFHFSSANTWEVFELPVEIREDDTDVRVGVEFYGGVTDLWCDWIRVEPAGTSIAGRLKVLGDIRGFGNLTLGSVLNPERRDTVLRLESYVNRTRIEFREWRPSPQYGFDVEYDADNNALVIRAQDGPEGPKEWLRILRHTGEIQVDRPSTDTPLLTSRVDGKSRFTIFPQGRMQFFSDDGSTLWVDLVPTSGGLLTHNAILVDREEVGQGVLRAKLRGTTRLEINAAGELAFLRPGGSVWLSVPDDASELRCSKAVNALQGLRVGGVEVIGPDRTLKNVRASCLNIREFQRGAGEPAVSALVEPHVEGRQLVPLAVRAQVGSTTDFKRSWEILDAIWDGRRIVAWSIYIAFSEETGLTEAVVKAIDEEGVSYPVARASEEGDKDGSAKIWALEC